MHKQYNINVPTCGLYLTWHNCNTLNESLHHPWGNGELLRYSHADRLVQALHVLAVAVDTKAQVSGGAGVLGGGAAEGWCVAAGVIRVLGVQSCGAFHPVSILPLAFSFPLPPLILNGIEHCSTNRMESVRLYVSQAPHWTMIGNVTTKPRNEPTCEKVCAYNMLEHSYLSRWVVPINDCNYCFVQYHCGWNGLRPRGLPPFPLVPAHRHHSVSSGGPLLRMDPQSLHSVQWRMWLQFPPHQEHCTLLQPKIKLGSKFKLSINLTFIFQSLYMQPLNGLSEEINKCRISAEVNKFHINCVYKVTRPTMFIWSPLNYLRFAANQNISLALC